MEVSPSLPQYLSSPPPHYNATAATTERVIEPSTYGNGSSPSLSSAGPAINHATVHSNSHILVILPRSGHSLNRQGSPQSLPAYGRQATVSGSLSLTSGRWTSAISKVAVSLKGQASSVLIQEGMQGPVLSRELFFVSQTLWKNKRGNTLNPPHKSMKFELHFPKSILDGRLKGHVDLSPTFEEETRKVYSLATRVKIEYSLRVDVWRKGLWSHKR